MGKKYVNFNFEEKNIHVLEKTDGYKNDVQFTSIEVAEGEKKSLTIRKLKHSMGMHKIKAKAARVIIPESSLVIRRLLVPKYILDIKGYIEDNHITQLETFMETPVYDFVIQKDHNDDQVVILFAIANDDLLYYHDVVKSLGKTLEKTYTSYEVLYGLFQSYIKRTPLENNLVIKIEDNKLFMVIYENGVPVFSQVKDLESNSKEELVQDLTSKINLLVNYYSRRLSTTRGEIEEIFIIDNLNLEPELWSTIITEKQFTLYEYSKLAEQVSFELPSEQVFNFIITQGGENNE